LLDTHIQERVLYSQLYSSFQTNTNHLFRFLINFAVFDVVSGQMKSI